MSITCPNCLTVYQIQLSPSSQARKMKCKKCAHVWVPQDEIFSPAYDDPGKIQNQSQSNVSPVATFPSEMPTASLDVTDASLSDLGDARNQQLKLNASLQSFKTSSLISKIKQQSLIEDKERAQHKGHVAKGSVWRKNRGQAEFLAACVFVILSCLCLSVFRQGVVSAFPDLATLYERIGLSVNSEGLVFQNLKVSLTRVEKIPTLIIAGDIQNITPQVRGVPKIQIAVVSELGTELYSWVIPSPHAALSANDVVSFEGQLVDPPADTFSIVVSFLKAP